MSDRDIDNQLNIVDVTLRDGGLTNGFRFSDAFVKHLYETNSTSGIQYMEFGYKASDTIFSKDEFGKWKFCEEQDIRDIVGDNNTPMKISVMADVGRTNYQKDIIDKKDSVIDMVRVAAYAYQLDELLEMVACIKEKGYEVTCNIMAISTNTLADIEYVLERIATSKADGIYLVDSYGALYPDKLIELLKMYIAIGHDTGKYIGIHAHNNQQLAFANTILAIEQGCKYADVSMNGIGRGAGNCPMENLMAYVKFPSENMQRVLQFIQEDMLALKDDGIVWGYDIPYLISGMLNQHPREAMKLIHEKSKSYTSFYRDGLIER